MDFVIMWVDGSDPIWQKDFYHYSNLSGGDKRELCFRDWGFLKFWFRGVEKFTPWVNKIHFVTYGHYPEWLNTSAPKLNIVNHKDFIPQKYLPTFNANAIEINIHRIKELAEEFVLFNDDFFIIDELPHDYFFINSLPRDMAVMNTLSGGGISHFILNDIEILNNHFNKYDILKNKFSSFFSLKYGFSLLRTLLLLPWPRFTGFKDQHLPQPYLKSIYEDIWENDSDILTRTSECKFRDYTNVNQYLFRYWQIAKGKYSPYNIEKNSAMYCIRADTISDICHTIKKQKKKIIVVNDNEICEDFELYKNKIIESFNSILPKKSTYEL